MLSRRGIKMGGERDMPRSGAWTPYDRAVGNDVLPAHPVPTSPQHENTGRQLTSAGPGQMPAGLEQILAGMSPAELYALALQLLQRAGPGGI